MRLLQEASENISIDKKNYIIQGIFIQCDVENGNGRIYPLDVVKPEVDKYITEKIKTKRSLGELGHSDSPSIKLDRVSHLITELKLNGSNYYGKAIVADTPRGKIIKNLIDLGVTLGVSTRGIGSVKKKNGVDIVDSDFVLSTIDVVSEPSAPAAFVEGLMESVDKWIIDDNGEFIEKAQSKIRRTKMDTIEKVGLNLFKEFMKKY